jgi:DNA-binding beta-propeller fold protein YncE
MNRSGLLAPGVFALRIVACHALTAAEPPVLEPFAGTGAPGYSGNNIPATTAELREPGAMALSRTGVLFFCDTGNHTVRQIDLRGVISTVAGNGQPGFAGNGGPAAHGQFHSPAGLCLDLHDNLCIADTLNHCIRGIGRGNIRSLVGRRGPGFAGDGGPAEQAQLNAPQGVAFDREGNFFIADTGNHRVRRVDRQTGIITTVAGSGKAETAIDSTPLTTAALNSPRTLAADLDGRIWVATADGLVRLDLQPGVLHRPVATSGSHPGALSVAADGRLFLADHRDGAIRILPPSPADTPWQILLPPGTLASPRGLAWDPKTGALVIANTAKHQLVRLPNLAQRRAAQ